VPARYGGGGRPNFRRAVLGGSRRAARATRSATTTRSRELREPDVGMLTGGHRLRRILQLAPCALRVDGVALAVLQAGGGWNREPVVAVALPCVEQVLAEFPCRDRRQQGIA